MHKQFLVLLGLTGLAVSASATPACPTGGSLSTFLTPGYSCEIGSEMFSNFSYSSSASGGASAVSAAGVTVYTLGPNGTGAYYEYPSIGFQLSANWNALAGQTTDSNLGFTVTAEGPQVEIEDIFLGQGDTALPTSSVTPDGAATVSEDACGPAPCTPSSALSAHTWEYGGPNYTVNFQPTNETMFAPVDSLTVAETIDVTGGTSGDAHLNLVVDAYQQVTIPEPMSLSLIGGGLALLGMGWARRRRGE